mmetsp:Transcript_14827/g.22916  ORF Transcript_14827/g.22916 Transcript_14827/m.22916 type:complete len:202 (-) Transcript_14827:96-701(-)
MVKVVSGTRTRGQFADIVRFTKNPWVLHRRTAASVVVVQLTLHQLQDRREHPLLVLRLHQGQLSLLHAKTRPVGGIFSRMDVSGTWAWELCGATFLLIFIKEIWVLLTTIAVFAEVVRIHQPARPQLLPILLFLPSLSSHLRLLLPLPSLHPHPTLRLFQHYKARTKREQTKWIQTFQTQIHSEVRRLQRQRSINDFVLCT